ncbi:MAG: phospholipid carrier-dependent glycosyltransferase [Anaerolineae bacterium]|nr:phospholipid carrier-dependent glycosyltransferase [Anaerolineae bacterium]
MRSRWLDALAVALLAAALAARLVRLDAFIAADELRWVCRSLAFGQALAAGDFKNTFQTGHPGVVTMWLGTLAVPTGQAPASVLATCRATENGESPSAATAAQLAELAATLFHMRVAPALFNSLLLALAYWLTRRLVGPWLALVGLALLAFDPFLLAHSRVLHLDAILSGLMLVSALLLLQAFSRQPSASTHSSLIAYRSSLILSGLVAGIALAQKVAAVFLWPWAGLALLALAWRQTGFTWRPARSTTLGIVSGSPTHASTTATPPRAALSTLLTALIRLGLAWGLALVVGVLLVWPAAWSNPVGTAQGVVAKAAVEGGNPHQAGQVLGEEVVEDPGPLMYVLALVFRASPWMLLGLGVGGWWVVRRWVVPQGGFALGGGMKGSPTVILSEAKSLASIRRDASPSAQHDSSLFNGITENAGTLPVVGVVIGLLGLAVLFGLLISLSPKKFDRYLLPSFPPLDLVAGIALAAFVTQLRNTQYASRNTHHASHSIRPLALALILLVQLVIVLPHAPYYLTYYNPLLGGGQAATHWLLVGWGEGYDLAAAYLNRLPNAAGTQVAVRGVSQFAPLFVGETRSAPGYRPYQTDYVVLYSNEVQRHRSEGLMARYLDNPAEKPVYVARLNGIDYAWVYANTTATRPLADLGTRREPDDVVVVNGASLAAKGLPVGQQAVKVYGHFGPTETVEALAGLAPGARLWYLRYPEADPGVILDTLREQAILDSEPRHYPDIELWAGRAAPAADQAANAEAGPLRLTAWGVGREPLQPERGEGLRLSWQVATVPTSDLTAVLEVLDPAGQVAGRSEKALRSPTLTPTSRWAVGERVETLIPLTLPPATPPGTYTARVQLKGAGSAISLGPLIVGRNPTPTTPDIPHPQLVNFSGAGVQLLGHGLTMQTIRPGDTLAVPLWWRATGAVSVSLVQMDLRDVRGQSQEVTPSAPLAVPLATLAWQPGEVFRGLARLTVPPGLPTGPAQVELNVRGAGGRLVLPAPAVLGQVWVRGTRLTEPPKPPQRAVDFQVGDLARLIGYDALPVKPGESLPLTLYWQASGPAPTAYSVFVHLLRPDDTILTQVDRAPGLGQYPTNTWRAGEVVVDPYTLDVPLDTPPGHYQVAVGWYTSQGRAPIRDGQDQPVPADRILLDVEVR